MIPDRFQWVYCQLDTLRRHMPSDIDTIRARLDELPTTLYDTYERILQGIPNERSQVACRLYHCIVAAIRPLRVEELAEISAIEFGPNEVTNLVEQRRPKNPEEAVLAACSSLINVQSSKAVQFSHISVKEYMTSDRLQTSNFRHLRDYYVSPELAHTVLARACIAVLLRFDEKVDRKRVATFPLAKYASEHWLDHARFENVQSRIQGALQKLFNPKSPFLRACIWMHDVELEHTNNPEGHSALKQPPLLNATPLYYAAFCGFSELAKWLITVHREDVNAQCYDDRTPLHVASDRGHLGAVRVLLDHGAHTNSQNFLKWMPLHFASARGHLKVVQLLLEHKAPLDARSFSNISPVYLASQSGHLEVVRLLGDRGADMHIRADDGLIPFHVATNNGHRDVAELLLTYSAK